MEPVLKAINISKVYDLGGEKIDALKNVSLEINQGEYVAIVGKSGSGKSTLMHILGLLDTPTSGNVILNGQDVTKYKEKALAKMRNKEIGFVFQFFNLLPRTSTLENVMLPLKYSDTPKNQWKQKALEMVKLVDLENRIHNKSNELSGGQKQRVAIARALINNPSIIFADEPTGNLDSKTGEEIVKLFQRLHNEGKTIILVTHDEELATVAQRQIIIRDGQIIS
jgi:putative ABC transport system ATP-binding protein